MEVTELLLHYIGEQSKTGTAFLSMQGKFEYANRIFREAVGISDLVGKDYSVIDFLRIKEILEEEKNPISRVITLQETRYLLQEKMVEKDDGIKGIFVQLYPVENETIRQVLRQYRDLKTRLDKYEAYHESTAKYTIRDLMGQSPFMTQLKGQICKISQFESSVLITGETGTGKEMVAHAIHSSSLRCQNPFIVVNCGALPEQLIESELFGYEEGSFTGARKGGKIGKFEAANGGTIFLDEIGDLPKSIQVKILRALQEKQIQRIGGHLVKDVDVRVVAATNCPLEEMVESGQLREDLYYRINVIRIHLLPLRERREDIVDLAEFFLQKLNEKYMLDKQFAKDFSVALKKQIWPGNIRQLQNVIEHAFVLAGDEIHAEHLPMLPKSTHSAVSLQEDLGTQLERFEKQLIVKALEEAKGNRTQAAEILGIHRTSLYQKLQKYNLSE